MFCRWAWKSECSIFSAYSYCSYPLRWMKVVNRVVFNSITCMPTFFCSTVPMISFVANMQTIPINVCKRTFVNVRFQTHSPVSILSVLRFPFSWFFSISQLEIQFIRCDRYKFYCQLLTTLHDNLIFHTFIAFFAFDFHLIFSRRNFRPK